jgi:hypothetical protein
MRKSRKYKNKPTQDAFPLSWPSGWKRTQPEDRERNLRYRISLRQSMEELTEELRKMVGNLGYVVLSSNIPLKRDGSPHTIGVINPEDPGVALYWYDPAANASRVIACDAWVEVRENVRALALAIQALRQLERCRATEILDRAFQGFNALTDGSDPWWKVLEVNPKASFEEIKLAYKKKSLEHHPDRGGEASKMSEVNRAYQEASEEFT